MAMKAAAGGETTGHGATPSGATYALSPMQTGMLFQSLLGGATTGGYDVEQMHMVLREGIDVAAFGRAWTLIAGRHPILSTSFRWEGVEQPEQIVHPGVVVPISVEDWSGLGEEERDRRREELLSRDRALGFDLGAPPLMRVHIVRLGGGITEAVWTFHHILLDGRSFEPVLREVFDAYEAMARGVSPALPPPPRPYADYIAWLATRDIERSRRFFRDLLRGKATPTPLPGAEPAALPLPRRGYGERSRFVGEAIARGARELARRTRTTLGTVVQAAWALVLARFTGDDDVLFGVTRAGRRSALGGEAEAMIGLYINTVPVRARVGDDRTVGDLLADLRAQSVAMRDHEATSLVEAQGQSEIARGTPLFETLLVFEDRELNQSLRAGGDRRWDGRTFTLHEQPAPPLDVTVIDGAALQIRVLFDRRRFRDAVVDRLSASLCLALEGLSRGEDLPLGEVSVLSAAERRRILVEWNDTARPSPDLRIHEPFERRASAQPHAVAVEHEGRSLTYGGLERRANQLAHALRERGARPGVHVGICLERGIDLVVALLAVAKSGAAYVPLDPEWPADRLAFMLADARAILVVTEDGSRSRFSTPALCLDGGGAALLATMPASRPPHLGSPSDVCYTIFTSGSTGAPKGAVLSHRAVINTFDWVTRAFAVGPGDRLLFVTSPCFDLSVYDTFGALGAGATVVVASRAQLKDPEALARALVEQRITVWDSAPLALECLAPFFPRGSRAAPLRLVMLSGDWIPLSLPGAIREAFPGARVVSLGGATEAAIWSNWFPVGALDPRWTSVPYGVPIQNARYHVLDRFMRPAPIGVAGDLYIGGACLAEGYLNRPELTAERFVPDPFSAAPGERLYRTGDNARYFDDGKLELLGRADFQVKIRGFRVELREVESVLLGLPGVREAACAAYTDASGQRSLIAYVVPRDGARVDEASVKEGIGRKLPSFMVPSHVVTLAALPLSPNGKLDRAALPRPGARAAPAASVAPRTELERRLAAIWEDLLQTKPIGVTESFFALGGHSLLAVMLVSRVGAELGVRLPLSQVLEQPTIETLAASLERGARESGSPRGGRHLVTMNPRGSRPPLALVPGIGGYGFVFQGLTRALGEDQPLHLLQAIGAEGDGEISDFSIEQMAEIYEGEIVQACSAGPIILGGYSIGALIAFELVHRLRLRDRPVPLLVSLDGFAPGFPRPLPLPRRLMAHASEVLRREHEARRAYVRARFENVKGRILRLLGHPEAAVPDIPHADEALNRRLRKLSAGLWRARDRYRSSRVEPCELLLVKSDVPTRWQAADMDDPLYGWRSFVSGPIHVETVPGEHLMLLQEANCGRLAAAIGARIAEVGGPARSSLRAAD